MDVIFISELRLDTLVGVYEWERRLPQTLELNLEIGVPGKRARNSDAIADTIDYCEVVARLREDLQRRHFFLLERLAEHVAQLLLDEFGAPWVKVSAAKLGMIPGVKRVGVCVERGKPDTP